MLMQQLQDKRADGTANDKVYAIVDAETWDALGLTPGASFKLTINPGTNQTITFVAVAKYTNIPGIKRSDFQNIGILIDYQNYAAVYKTDTTTDLVPNTVWLKTSDDAASLASVRKAFPDLNDRRALLEAVVVDPTHVNLASIFGLGIVAALLLALIGSLVVSWVNIATRTTNFAALKALGWTSWQINAVLIWEHGIVYFLAVLVGVGLGKLFAFNALAVYRLLEQTVYRNINVSINGTISESPPIHVSFPLMLAASLVGIFFAINIVALILGRIAFRPKVSQVLRLNED
jgi:ABC-type antimicrobial peptide transport system permease subunit